MDVVCETSGRGWGLAGAKVMEQGGRRRNEWRENSKRRSIYATGRSSRAGHRGQHLSFESSWAPSSITSTLMIRKYKSPVSLALGLGLGAGFAASTATGSGHNAHVFFWFLGSRDVMPRTAPPDGRAAGQA